MDRVLPERYSADFRNVVPFLSESSQFFEPIESYEPVSPYIEALDMSDAKYWRSYRSGVWMQMAPPNGGQLRAQGWKIHISTVPAEASEVLALVARYCFSNDIPFKFLLDEEILVLCNSRNWSRASSGKFITIYPQTTTAASSALHQLSEALDDKTGPYILSDRRYGDSKVVFYRFGGHKALKDKDSDGKTMFYLVGQDGSLIEDQRQAYWYLPDSIVDPFAKENDSAEDNSQLELKDGRYSIESVLSFNNTGGVYVAFDKESQQRVVIKEARPHTSFNRSGVDSVSVRQHEWKILSKLADLDCVPEAIDWFKDWEHSFLVESWINGPTFWSWLASNSVFLDPSRTTEETDSYIRTLIRLLTRIVCALKAVHERGVLIGDVSLNNILIESTTLKPILTDFESSSDNQVKPPIDYWTPGFRPNRGEAAYGVSQELYALGAVIGSSLCPVQQLDGLQQTPFRAFLEGLPDFERVPNRLKQLVYRLTENEADQGVSLDFVLKELEMAAAEVGNAKQDAAISTHRKTSRGPSVEGYANLIDSMLDAVLANMEPERRDRLFPASPNLKSSIGYSHGSIGVARFLHFASGAVPHEVKEWVEREMTSSAEDPPGLYGGYAGVSWVAQELGWNEISDIALNRAWNHPKLFSQVDMYSGVCGVSLALLKRWVRTGSDVDLTRARLLADWIMETVDPHSPPERVGSGEIQDDVHYLGFAHGRSGLSLLMLYMGLATNDPRYIGAGQHYLNFDLHFRVGVSEGRYSSIPNYIGSSAYHPYWYSGTAGVLMTAFRYYAYEPSRELLNIVHSMIPDVARNFTFTPGLHYGLAGLGSCLMDGEKFGVPGVDWCSAVRRNIESVRLYGVEQSRGVSFPGDHLVRLSHDISTGNAGIGMYMLRMLREDVHPHFEVDELLIP